MADLGINDELKNILTKMEYKGGEQIKFSELKQKQSVMGSQTINRDTPTSRSDLVQDFSEGPTAGLCIPRSWLGWFTAYFANVFVTLIQVPILPGRSRDHINPKHASES